MAAHRFPRALPVVALLLAAASCGKCEACEDEAEEEEERNLVRDHFWRAELEIRGQGSLKTAAPVFDCTSDGVKQRGECGPKLVRFKELAPPLVRALPAPGWTFDHWEAETRAPDGSVAPRRGPMPDGPAYLNGFGYADTGELEHVRAVFVLEPSTSLDASTADGSERSDAR